MRKIKFACLLLFAGLGIFGFFSESGFVQTANSFTAGPPAGFSGAPDENNCASCHLGPASVGQFAILNAPASYTPGQTYQFQVRHTTADTTRLKWGFQMTALAGQNSAGTFANANGNTQTITENGRFYIQHTTAGTYTGQTLSAEWTVNWTAPSALVGPVTFYAAGNQANNGNGPDGDQLYTTNSVSQATVRRPIFDFDGDSKTDLSIFRPGPVTGAEWWHLRSSDGGNRATQFGTSTDTVVPADFTGDGKTDIAFWRPSTGFWYVLRSDDLSFFAFPFGATGDIPTPADYDGDGKSDAAVYRPSTTTWFISRSTGGTQISNFGAANDLPVAADYDGDGKADIAVFRRNGQSGTEWWLQRSTDLSVFAVQFGSPTDKAVSGDYTGDGKADIAFWTPSSGNWFVLRSEDLSYFAFPFGTATDVPSPGDYDGDGRFDAAVFRPSTSTWFAQRSTAGTLIQQFGTAGDVPLPSVFVR
ncbi:MAG: VCBS repeat-containing protein [Acidobacteria bacterium]|nr:VCBS repeat-containing protein [Acidobacteriota bacterium]MBK7932291.1 VCBS repeat-containing protein [Acidobacteriota bacterium]